jgi:hypothetical protein
MEEFNFNKEQFIYKVENSISDDLIDEIIEKFKLSSNVSKYTKFEFSQKNIPDILKNSNQEDKILNLEECNLNNNTTFIINNDIEWQKIKNYLIKEINNNLCDYISKINNRNLISRTKNYGNEYIPFNIKCIDHDSELTIKINEYSNDNINNFFHIEKKIKKYCLNSNLFYFIWFLNDYEGEYIFWDSFHIKPEKGLLLIFPISWCFSYSEIIKLYQKKYFIFGYVNIF